MEQTRPPEEFVSSRTPVPPARAWRTLAVVLCLVLVSVLGAGLWARWRPLSDVDATRLRARATVESVRADFQPDPSVLPDAVLSRQVAAFGPAATPSQTRHLGTRDTAGPPHSLSDAAARLEEVARTAPEGDLAATAAGIAERAVIATAVVPAGAVITAAGVTAVVLVTAHAKATCSVCCLPRAQSSADMGFLPLGCTRVSSTA